MHLNTYLKELRGEALGPLIGNWDSLLVLN